MSKVINAVVAAGTIIIGVFDSEIRNKKKKNSNKIMTFSSCFGFPEEGKQPVFKRIHHI